MVNLLTAPAAPPWVHPTPVPAPVSYHVDPKPSTQELINRLACSLQKVPFRVLWNLHLVYEKGGWPLKDLRADQILPQQEIISMVKDIGVAFDGALSALNGISTKGESIETSRQHVFTAITRAIYMSSDPQAKPTIDHWIRLDLERAKAVAMKAAH